MAIPTDATDITAIEAKLKDKLKKVEALLAGAATPGEREASEAARERIQNKLRDLGNTENLVEMAFNFENKYVLRLFRAVCRRNGLMPYRKPRQRQCSVMVKVTSNFLQGQIWVEFLQLRDLFRSCLYETTLNFIQDHVFYGAEDFESW